VDHEASIRALYEQTVNALLFGEENFSDRPKTRRCASVAAVMKHRLHVSDEIEGFLQVPLGRDELRFRELQNTPPIRMWAQVALTDCGYPRALRSSLIASSKGCNTVTAYASSATLPETKALLLFSHDYSDSMPNGSRGLGMGRARTRQEGRRERHHRHSF
jgi:hypothetical protein